MKVALAIDGSELKACALEALAGGIEEEVHIDGQDLEKAVVANRGQQFAIWRDSQSLDIGGVRCSGDRLAP